MGKRILTLLVALIAAVALVVAANAAEEGRVASAKIVAVGLPGAGAVTQVGVFHPGGPVHDKPEFAAYTVAGKILDPNRVLVTSSSNFVSPKAKPGQPEGTALSLYLSAGG